MSDPIQHAIDEGHRADVDARIRRLRLLEEARRSTIYVPSQTTGRKLTASLNDHGLTVVIDPDRSDIITVDVDLLIDELVTLRSKVRPKRKPGRHEFPAIAFDMVPEGPHLRLPSSARAAWVRSHYDLVADGKSSNKLIALYREPRAHGRHAADRSS